MGSPLILYTGGRLTRACHVCASARFAVTEPGFFDTVILAVQPKAQPGRDLGVEPGQSRPLDYYKHYYKNACAEWMPVITIVIPI